MKERILQYYKEPIENKYANTNYPCEILPACTTRLSKHSHLQRPICTSKHPCSPNKKHAFDNKSKSLLQLALANVMQCPTCTKAQLKNALASGATSQELTETLFLATVDKTFNHRSRI